MNENKQTYKASFVSHTFAEATVYECHLQSMFGEFKDKFA